MSGAVAPKRDHAAEALDTLRSAVLAEAPALKAEVESYARALRDLHAASDLMPGMQAAVSAALAAEAVGKAASAVREATRAALVRCFDETGCPGVMTQGHTATVVAGRRAVVVTDPDALPAEFLTVPAPDKAAIAKALAAGRTVSGAVLANGAEPHLQIKARKTP